MFDSTLARLTLIVVVSAVAHLATLLIQAASRRILMSRLGSESKVLTVSGFASSVVVFTIYFTAIGFVLSELGVSLTTYLASASVIGLAVSFGSQGVVQDVINGLTVVFTDLIDIGDMVELGGQVGIVEGVGMRFTVLVNFLGARVYVPNRSIMNVVNYRQGFVRAYLDVRLPEDETVRAETEQRLAKIADAVYEQYPGIVLLPPRLQNRFSTGTGDTYLRIRFKIWPGQGALLETTVKAGVVQAMRAVDASYADWMVSVHYRAESPDPDSSRRLPRPHALRRS